MILCKCLGQGFPAVEFALGFTPWLFDYLRTEFLA